MELERTRSIESIGFPDCCCVCLGKAETSLGVKGTFYESAGLAKTRTTVRTFDVPICNSCARAQEKANQKAKTIRWVILIGVGLVFVVVGIPLRAALSKPMHISLIDPGDVGAYHIATFVWGFIVGLIPARLFAHVSGPVVVNRGGTIVFKNREYHDRFVAANPGRA